MVPTWVICPTRVIVLHKQKDDDYRELVTGSSSVQNRRCEVPALGDTSSLNPLGVSSPGGRAYGLRLKKARYGSREPALNMVSSLLGSAVLMTLSLA